MKRILLFKSFLLIMILIFFGSIGFASGNKKIIVSNAAEFLKALGSDRIIECKPGIYNISSCYRQSGAWFKWESVYDGNQLIIHDVSNLTIQGPNGRPIKVLAEPRYAFVLSFSNVRNLTLRSVEAGHTNSGFCTGGVFAFNQCSRVIIDKCDLFGCGTEGLNLRRVTDLKFIDSIIRDCTYGIMTINESKDIQFNRAAFHDNREFDLITVKDSKNVVFSECQINNNWTCEGGMPGYALFKVENSIIDLKNGCNLVNNQCDFFVCSDKPFADEGIIFNRNEFRNGEFYNLSESNQGANEPTQSEENAIKITDFMIRLSSLQSRIDTVIQNKDIRQNDQLINEWRNDLEKLETYSKDSTSDKGSCEMLLGQYYYLGVKLKVEGCWDKSEEHYLRALGCDPDDLSPHFYLGQLYFETNILIQMEQTRQVKILRYVNQKTKPELVQKALREMEKSITEVSRFNYYLFVLYYFNGQFSDAVRYVEKELALRPNDPVLLQYRQRAKEKIGSTEIPVILKTRITLKQREISL